MNYMLDTNICVKMIRGKDRDLAGKVAGFPPQTIGLSSIVVAELQYGVKKSAAPGKNQAALEVFLTPFVIVPFGPDDAIVYGGVRSHLEKLGTPIGPLDALIATSALKHGSTLVTNNVREFERVPGLNVEDWST